ncbi:Hypothetical protein NTJ_00543 [Nesidiocoris tenuis]|uniref:Uncharacterized protein n=1 Tax=Nesidiocoris tenuis TaxID=355587 RepID=A0ABN7A715_9HEMI|nr:Hypothetical protein NTJ_00543 [Nesidiocoris tenuis]
MDSTSEKNRTRTENQIVSGKKASSEATNDMIYHTIVYPCSPPRTLAVFNTVYIKAIEGSHSTSPVTAIGPLMFFA